MLFSPALRAISVLPITTIRPFLVHILPPKESAKEQMLLNLQFTITAYICVTGVIPFDHLVFDLAVCMCRWLRHCLTGHFVSTPTPSPPGASHLLHCIQLGTDFIPKPPSHLSSCHIQKHNAHC